ncbi:MAG: class I SAM-dependent methyltransferase [Candidatus Woesebacteria bacterium]|nr:MAG: class I SAM-dependent methyltransferase [Candidatus Woesebacteria bacterium]
MISKSINTWDQTKHWEEACIETRRNPDERIRRLRFFRIKKKEKILDLGCGDGLNVHILYKKGVKNIFGVDISDALIKSAKRLTPKAKFYLASAEKLPFKDETFDVVLVDSVFHHFMKYRKALGEINRVLKKKGRLCFIEPHKSIVRSLYDAVCELPISKYIPFLKKRRISYLGEIKFMRHWLKTEDDFYETLTELKFVERLRKLDIMSTIGIYEKASY